MESKTVIDLLKTCADNEMPLVEEEVLRCFHGFANVTKKSGLLLAHLLTLPPHELERRGDKELELYLHLREAVEGLGLPRV